MPAVGLCVPHGRPGCVCARVVALLCRCLLRPLRPQAGLHGLPLCKRAVVTACNDLPLHPMDVP